MKYTDIRIIDYISKKQFTIAEADFYCNVPDSIDQETEYTELKIKDYAHAIPTDSFVPSELSLRFIESACEDLEEFNEFMTMEGRKLVIEFDKEDVTNELGYRTFYLFGYVPKNSIKLGTYREIEYTFRTQTNFLSRDYYAVSELPDVIVGDVLPVTLPFMLGSTASQNGSFSVTIPSMGTGLIYLDIFIYGPATNPKFGVNGRADNNENSFITEDLEVLNGSILEVISQPGYKKVIMDNTDLEQKIDYFNSSGWCYLDPLNETNTINFENCTGGVTIYAIYQWKNLP